MTLLLDPDIRDWVVLPLFVIIVFAGLLRQVVAQYMQGAKQPIPAAAQRVQSMARHCHALRTAAAHSMTTSQWYLRRDQAVVLLRAEAKRLESADGEAAADPMEAMMSNPMGMMGGNMVFMVQNMVMMQAIQHFFSGFILLRVPFSLTVGFKHMFQRGVADMPDLEPSYVSSVSWYFLVMYGLRSFFKLVMGAPSTEQREQEAQLQSFGLQNPPNPTANKQDNESLVKNLRAEADNLELHQHKSEMDGAEKRLLGKRYPKKKAASNATSDFLVGKKKSKRKNQ